MTSALWLIVWPMMAIPVVYLLRRSSWGALIAAGVALYCAYLSLQVWPGEVFKLLGRPLVLNQLSQATLAILFSSSAVLFLISALSPSFIEQKTKQRSLTASKTPRAHGGIQGQEGRTFYPVGLSVLALLVMASLTRHLGITAIIMQIAAILTVFIIQGGRLLSIRASLRFLSLISLSTPLFLLAAWQIDFRLVAESTAKADYLPQTTLLIGLGFCLWLAVIPFHSWLTATATDSYPASAVFVLLVFPAITLSILLNVLQDYPVLLSTPQALQVMLIAGVVTAFGGGFLASLQRGFSHLMGYTALYDMGCLIALLSFNQPSAPTLMLTSFVVRAIGLSLLAVSAVALRSQQARDGFTELRAVAHTMPIATIGLILGGFTLAGVPFTAGFMIRWELWGSLSTLNLSWLILVGVGNLGVVVGYLRGLYQLLQPLPPANNPQPTWQIQEPWLLVVVIVVLGISSLILGIIPQEVVALLHDFTAEAVLPLHLPR